MTHFTSLTVAFYRRGNHEGHEVSNHDAHVDGDVWPPMIAMRTKDRAKIERSERGQDTEYAIHDPIVKLEKMNTLFTNNTPAFNTTFNTIIPDTIKAHPLKRGTALPVVLLILWYKEYQYCYYNNTNPYLNAILTRITTKGKHKTSKTQR